jgi:hypothetical protein
MAEVVFEPLVPVCAAPTGVCCPNPSRWSLATTLTVNLVSGSSYLRPQALQVVADAMRLYLVVGTVLFPSVQIQWVQGGGNRYYIHVVYPTVVEGRLPSVPPCPDTVPVPVPISTDQRTIMAADATAAFQYGGAGYDAVFAALNTYLDGVDALLPGSEPPGLVYTPFTVGL